MGRPRGTARSRAIDLRLATGAGKLIGYIRVSTTGQDESGHSLDGQRERLIAFAAREGYELVGIVCDVASGAKERENLAVAQRRIEAGEAEGLLTPKLDRLGRSQIHLAQLVRWMMDVRGTLVTSDEGYHVRCGSLVNEALPFLIAMAEVERVRISRRTSEGLGAARKKGVRLGSPVRADEDSPAVCRMCELRRARLTIGQIVRILAEEGYVAPRGGAWSPSSVYGVLRRVCADAMPEGGFGDGGDLMR